MHMIGKTKTSGHDLSDVPTCELVAELKARVGVETHYIEPYSIAKVKTDGPAVILVVRD